MSHSKSSPDSNKGKLIMGVLLGLVVCSGVLSYFKSGSKPAKKEVKKSDFIAVTLPPPPPPPPPPPKVEPPEKKVEEPKEAMIEQEPVPEDEPPPQDEAPEEPGEEALGTNIEGNGPDMGLSRGSGNGRGTGKKGSRLGGGSKWGYYAAKIQNTISTALRSNQNTRSASFSMKVRIWLNPNGRIIKSKLLGSSGDVSVDQAIRDQVLVGLTIPDTVPEGMPMPITIRISASK